VNGITNLERKNKKLIGKLSQLVAVAIPLLLLFSPKLWVLLGVALLTQNLTYPIVRCEGTEKVRQSCTKVAFGFTMAAYFGMLNCSNLLL
jgi:hypothetical protein